MRWRNRWDSFGSGNSNGSIIVSGGTLYINSSGDGIDANGTLEITGGHTTLTGPTQEVIAVNTGIQNPGSEMIVKDSDENIILSHQPELVKGETYTLIVGSQSGEISASYK